MIEYERALTPVTNAFGGGDRGLFLYCHSCLRRDGTYSRGLSSTG